MRPEEKTSPEPVFIVHQPGEGIFGVAASAEAGKVIVAANVQQYFSGDIVWEVAGEGTDHEQWEGTYSDGPYTQGTVFMDRYPVATTTDVPVWERRTY